MLYHLLALKMLVWVRGFFSVFLNKVISNEEFTMLCGNNRKKYPSNL